MFMTYRYLSYLVFTSVCKLQNGKHRWELNAWINTANIAVKLAQVFLSGTVTFWGDLLQFITTVRIQSNTTETWKISPITESWLGVLTVDSFSPSALRFTICVCYRVTVSYRRHHANKIICIVWKFGGKRRDFWPLTHIQAHHVFWTKKCVAIRILWTSKVTR